MGSLIWLIWAWVSIGHCGDWLWLWAVAIACRLRADAQAPWYCTGTSSFWMTWNSSTISVASSSLYCSR
jgi:hypothetical protein